MYIPTFEDVQQAHERIKPYIHRTPVLTSSYFNGLTGAALFFKCENFQKAGAFKARGATNAVFGLSEADAKKGVATHSSGNHGLSLSYAAGRRGIPATVVMPRTAPETLSNISPKTKIYAAEPENADDAYRSFKAGHIIADDAPQTIADGLKVPLKERTWHFVSNYVTDVLLATEEEIVDAMYLAWQRMKIVIEPSSAVPLATILKNRELFEGKRVGVILTGGNVDLKKLPWMQD